MAEPTNKEELIEAVKRRLGHPIVHIDVTEEQFSDRVDQALRYYWDYHFNGADKIFYKYKITQTDKDNGYVPIPDNIIGAVQVFSIGEALSTSNIFSLRYQIALNDLYTLTSSSMLPYFSAIQQIGLIEEILVGHQPIRYNRHKDKIYVDMDWNTVLVGDYLMFECYEVVDPAVYVQVWRDRWLINYLEVLVKLQWGNNLKKFGGVQLIGGLQLNGQQIYDEALQDKKEMERDMIENLSIPVNDFVG